VFAPVPVGVAADAWLRFLTAVAGAQHPALARVVDGGVDAVEEGAMRWMASALIRGRRAAERIPEGPQAPITVVRRVRGLAAGLHLLHSRGVVHANVGPSHVLLRSDGSAVLVGYGRAFLRRDGVFSSRSPEVDPAYRAPEVGDTTGDRLPTPAADVYGVAACGWGMMTGRPPTPGERLAPLRSLGIDVPASLDDVIARASDPDPVARPTAEDLGQALAFAEASLSKPGGPA
jgi:serine/threonine protein kinase